jgi:hypothetical protein
MVKAMKIAGLSLVLALTGCCTHHSPKSIPVPETTQSLRGDSCFDGTVEKGCPSWALDSDKGKTFSHMSYTDSLAIIHYTDGTTTTSSRKPK